jgi:hypothetical protein
MPTNLWPIERRSARAPEKVPAKLLVRGAEGNYVCRGMGSDCSLHGMRIQISYPFLAIGQTVEVVLAGEPRLTATCRVAWIGQPGSVYTGQVGLEFISPLSSEHPKNS